MLKYTEQYREREQSQNVPNLISLTSKDLNEAKLLARKGMTQISDIIKALITEPSLADLDENGQQRAVSYMWSSELRKRMSIRHHDLTIREQADFVRRDINLGLLTSEEVGKIGHWARDKDLEFTPLAGDHIQPRRSWLGKEKDTFFCTLDTATETSHLDNLTKLRLHAYQNRSVN